MIKAKPSRTATRVAMRRAAHQLLDRPLVFEDPLAERILGAWAKERLREDIKKETPFGVQMRAWLAARSRLAEDMLAEAVADGTRQYVVLGAGMDTFGYRNPWGDVRVFEVDFPATQAWKRELLEANDIFVPESVTFAPVDFERESLGEGLARVGFKREEPAFFSWLGVTMYLARETTLGTLRWVRESCARNGICFDYMAPRETLGLRHKMAFDALASRVAAAGEPFVGFFAPEELTALLREMGYARVDDWAAARLNARYFADRADGLRVAGSLGNIMCARG
jgi:methyltransferase (TIGR00027 family)